MNRWWVIVRREVFAIVGKPAYWIGLMAVPLIVGVVVAVVAGSSIFAAAGAASRREADRARPQGVVDPGGVLVRGAMPAGFVVYPDESAARAALGSASISGYYVVATDYVASGSVRFVADKFSPLDSGSTTSAFEAILTNAVLGDVSLSARVQRPLVVESRERLGPRIGPAGPRFNPLPLGIGVMIAISLIGASSYLMQAVTQEKENRVMEVLLSSVTPLQLMTGKLTAHGLVSLIQLLLWSGSALGMLNVVRQFSGYADALTTPVLIMCALLYVLGYVTAGSMMSALGALMPGAKETQQLSFIVILPLILPMYLTQAISDNPSSTISTALSLIPFTAPVAMPMRLVNSVVPGWQQALCIALMLANTVLMVIVASRLFRAGSLLAGTKPTLRQAIAALR